MIVKRMRWLNPEKYESTEVETPGWVPIEEYVNDNGIYIGDKKWKDRLIKMGIFDPEPIPSEFEPKDAPPQICSIGKSEADGKWWGWSHRAMWGFKVGDVLKEGDSATTSGWTEEARSQFPVTELPVGFEVKSEADAKRAAIAFACSVG